MIMGEQEYRDAKNKYKEQLKKLEEKEKKEKKSLSDKEKKIEDIRKSRKEMKSKVAKQKIKKLEDLKRLKNSKTNLKAELSEAEKKVKNFYSAASERERVQRINSLRVQIGNLQREKNFLAQDKEYRHMKAYLHNNYCINGEPISDCYYADKDGNDIQMKISNIERRIDYNTREISRLNSIIEGLSNRGKDFTANRDRLKNELQKVKLKIDKHPTKMKKLEDDLLKQDNKFEEKIIKAKSKRNKAKKELATTSEKIKEVNAKIKHCKARINALKVKGGQYLKVSVGQFTFNQEGDENVARTHSNYSRKPHCPPKGVSGVTIGRGYDLKSRTASKVIADLTAAGLPKVEARKYAEAVGLSEGAARDYIKNHDLCEISLVEQKKLFIKDYEFFVEHTEYLCNKEDAAAKYGTVNWKTLNPAIKDIIIDLRYQGQFVEDTKIFLQKYVVANDLIGFRNAFQIRSNWPRYLIISKGKDNGMWNGRFRERIKYLNAAIARLQEVRRQRDDAYHPPVLQRVAAPNREPVSAQANTRVSSRPG